MYTVDREHVVDILPHLWVLDARMITGKKFELLVYTCVIIESQIKRLYAFGLLMHTHESLILFYNYIIQSLKWLSLPHRHTLPSHKCLYKPSGMTH